VRPRILITPWRRALPTYLGERTMLDALDPAYSDGIARAGGLPLVVPRPPDGDPAELLELADGVLLSGGGDVDPSAYGAPDAGGNADMDPAADAWELGLVHAARERRLPVLGICRGAQILAVAAGGRLVQRLPPEAAHREMGGLTPDEILAERHPVDVEPGSALADALGLTRVDVNTIHHHAIADPGSLRVSARAAGGLIEGVEPADGWPAIGVQWHPEKMSEPVQHRLFDWLIRRST
jgi:putative glutamine amidotransferase